VANTLNLFRHGAVGFIDWLDATDGINQLSPDFALIGFAEIVHADFPSLHLTTSIFISG
jgi:hypothetical protein